MSEAEIAAEKRLARLQDLQGKDRTLMLAATMALQNCAMTPLEKLQETRGMVTLKVTQDNFERKRDSAKKEYPKAGYKYEQPKETIFRNTDPGVVLAFGQTDFALKIEPLNYLENPHGLSVHNTKAKYHIERENMLNEKAKIAKGLEGKEDWALYHKKLPMGHIPLAQTLPDKFTKKEPTPFLQQEMWESAFILLARTV